MELYPNLFGESFYIGSDCDINGYTYKRYYRDQDMKCEVYTYMNGYSFFYKCIDRVPYMMIIETSLCELYGADSNYAEEIEISYVREGCYVTSIFSFDYFCGDERIYFQNDMNFNSEGMFCASCIKDDEEGDDDCNLQNFNLFAQYSSYDCVLKDQGMFEKVSRCNEQYGFIEVTEYGEGTYCSGEPTSRYKHFTSIFGYGKGIQYSTICNYNPDSITINRNDVVKYQIYQDENCSYPKNQFFYVAVHHCKSVMEYLPDVNVTVSVECKDGLLTHSFDQFKNCSTEVYPSYVYNLTKRECDTYIPLYDHYLKPLSSDLCEIKCFGKYRYELNVCSGNGECVENALCICENGYLGNECEQMNFLKKLTEFFNKYWLYVMIGVIFVWYIVMFLLTDLVWLLSW